MTFWVVLAGFYLWLGFTAGYFFRKWLEVSYLPRFQAHEAYRAGAETTGPAPKAEKVLPPPRPDGRTDK